MKTQAITLYSFRELSPQIQKRVIENLRASGDYPFDEWDDCTLSLWRSILAAFGFEQPTIYYSGFGSQGDGACFDSSVNLSKLAAFFAASPTPSKSLGGESPRELVAWAMSKIGPWESPNVRYWQWLEAIDVADCFEVSIYTRNHHYSHANARGVNCQTNEYRLQTLDDIMGHLCDEIESLRYQLCLHIYEELNNEFDYLTSDESVGEFAESLGEAFLHNGDIFTLPTA